MRIKNYAPGTLTNYQFYLSLFARFCGENGSFDLRAVTHTTLRSYALKLVSKGWSLATRYKALLQVGKFFQYLLKENLILCEPTAGIECKTPPPHLPQVLTQSEMDRLIDAARLCPRQGLRNVAMFELFYGCGLRVSEVTGLKLSEVDVDNGLVFVSLGKGGKDRVVPLGSCAALALTRYCQGLRTHSVKHNHSPYLFISHCAGSVNTKTVQWFTRSLGRFCGIKKRVYPHLIRHSMATHLMQNGAPLQVIQGILGHAQFSSTQVYTHLDLRFVREIWRRFHPRGRFVWRSQILSEVMPIGRV